MLLVVPADASSFADLLQPEKALIKVDGQSLAIGFFVVDMQGIPLRHCRS